MYIIFQAGVILGGSGINDTVYTTHDNDEIGNVVHNIGATYPKRCDYVHGIYHATARGHIWNNITYDNAGSGILTNHEATAVTIANNLSFANADDGIALDTVPQQNVGLRGDNFIVSNNILAYNGLYGLDVTTNAEGPHNHFLNDLIYGNRIGNFALNGSRWNTPFPVPQGIIEADPQFIRYAADGSGDYHLKLGSPAIDAGTSIGAPSTDFDGNARPLGAGYDIGAYEFLASVSTASSRAPSMALLPQLSCYHNLPLRQNEGMNG